MSVYLTESTGLKILFQSITEIFDPKFVSAACKGAEGIRFLQTEAINVLSKTLIFLL